MRCGREGAPLISLRLSAFVYRGGEYKSFPRPFFLFTEKKKGQHFNTRKTGGHTYICPTTSQDFLNALNFNGVILLLDSKKGEGGFI